MPPPDRSSASPPADGEVVLSREALSAWTHDLRNPLAALVANLHHLRETLAPHLDPESEEVFTECLALFGLLERYTANLDVIAQDASLAERGRPVDLVDLANEVAGRLGPYANVTGHRFRVLVEGTSPPSVESDRLILRRVLENLAANALENAPGGPVDLVIGTRRGGTREEGCVTVVDRGPPWPATGPALATYSSKRGPGSRYGRGLGIDAAKLAANAVGAKIELGSTPHGEAAAILAAPLAGALAGASSEGASRAPRPDGGEHA